MSGTISKTALAWYGDMIIDVVGPKQNEEIEDDEKGYIDPPWEPY